MFAKKIFIYLALCSSITIPVAAMAESAPGPDTPETRRAAALDYLKVVPVREMMTNMSANMAKNMKAEDAVTFKKIMDSVDDKAIETTIQNAMVRHFSTSEIKVLTEFYARPEGKSVMSKLGAYTADVMPAVQQEIYKAAVKSGAVKQPQQPQAAPGAAPTPAPAGDAK